MIGLKIVLAKEILFREMTKRRGHITDPCGTPLVLLTFLMLYLQCQQTVCGLTANSPTILVCYALYDSISMFV